jgi:glycosyltransferase involved in cell wall biosynthesis
VISQERQLKVVRVIDRLIYGGPTRNVVFLTEGLAKRGFDCELIAGVPADGEGDMTFWANENGVRPIKIEQMSRELGLKDALVIWKLFRLFRKLRPDIIHTHKSKAGATGRVAALFYKWITPSLFRLQPRKLRILHTFHGHIFHSYYGKFKTRVFVSLERVLARSTDCIVTVSEQQTEEIRDDFGVGKKTMFRVVPLGMEFGESLPNPAFRRENGIEKDDFLFAAAGRLCEVKNFSLMIQALAHAVKANPEFKAKLALVGDGHLRAELEKCARDLGVERDVIFTGFRSDVDAIYPALDLAALSSLNEGTPLTLIEAMSHGRPVLTTEVGGYADILGNVIQLSNGFTIWDHGVSVPSGDVEAYARALVFLAREPLLREQMGKRARVYARRQFSRERLISDMADLYCELWEGAMVPQPVRDPGKKKAVAN